MRRRLHRPREDHLGAQPVELDRFRRSGNRARRRGTGEIFREVAPEEFAEACLIPEFVDGYPCSPPFEDLDELTSSAS